MNKKRRKKKIESLLFIATLFRELVKALCKLLTH